ncbi:glycerate kinase type-2 family protein [Halorubrum sp. DTA98]|uniref:glycerate kinase type-2 family protein n=1 Tax=Halorubrum sp. DTA98 TaxID=3402163 RepID=UPI003AB0EDE4
MDEISCEKREAIARTPAHDVALDCLLAGIAAARPATLVSDGLSLREGVLTVTATDGPPAEYDLDAYDDVILIGGGNAGGSFTAAIETVLGDRLSGGVVVTDDPTPSGTVDVLAGDHPVPSERGVAHTRRVLDRAHAADEDDLVIATISGGGSALLAAPVASISLSDLRTVTEALLASGATIDEINAVRKHCSAIKGGQLARAAAPATVVTLVVSDVVGDDCSVIASGPTVPDPSTYGDALDVVDRYGLDVPRAVRDHLRAGADGDRPETPTDGDPAFERTSTHLLGSGRTALDAASTAAERRGYAPTVLAAGVRGEARESALTHIAIAEECRGSGSPAAPPAVLLSGGETTVTLGEDPGDGGPNQEFAVSSAVALDTDGIVVASVDTDGIDGSTDAAGGIVDATTLSKRDGRDAIDRNDTHPCLDEADALVRTGPTGTNVNDLRVIVVEDRPDHSSSEGERSTR